MPGFNRTRSYIEDRSIGTGHYHVFLANGPDHQDYTRDRREYEYNQCIDVVRNRRGVNLFGTNKKRHHALILKGYDAPIANVKVGKVVNDWQTSMYPPLDPAGTYGAWSVADKAAYITQLLAKSNPSTAVVSTPTIVGELGEIPRMIEDWGGKLMHVASSISAGKGDRSIVQRLLRTSKGKAGKVTAWSVFNAFLSQSSRNTAEATLTWKWGLRPLISDICNTLNVQGHVDRRVNWLNQLRVFGNVRRKVKLYHRPDVVITSGVLTIESYVGIVTAKRVSRMSEKVWGTAKWRLPVTTVLPGYLKDDASVRNKALKLVYGITDWELLKAAWDLMPWSWLADYMAHIGDFIDACNNSLNLIAADLCLMQTLENRESFDIISIPGWLTATLGQKQGQWVTKNRFVGFLPIPLPIASVPVITGSQWSTLGSLYVLKVQRRKKFRL